MSKKIYRHPRTKFRLVGPWVQPKWIVKVRSLQGISIGITEEQIRSRSMSLLTILCAPGIELKNSMPIRPA